MKKIKLLKARTINSGSKTSSEVKSTDDFSNEDSEQAINVESENVKPIKVSVDGFTSWKRKIRPTNNGMESQVEKPLLIVKSGHRVSENQIKGQCDICSGYDSHIENCSVDGCKKTLCLKHVYYFELGEKKTPYCLNHYKQAIDNHDTWNEQKGRK